MLPTSTSHPGPIHPTSLPTSSNSSTSTSPTSDGSSQEEWKIGEINATERANGAATANGTASVTVSTDGSGSPILTTPINVRNFPRVDSARKLNENERKKEFGDGKKFKVSITCIGAGYVGG
jgi:hypothetical protein